MKAQDVYRVIILPDIHVPFEDTKTLEAVESFMADQTFDEYVNLGDLMDFDQLSSFNKEKLRKLEARRILEDYSIANKILDKHQALIRKNNPNAKFTLIEGNHEERMERFLDKVPQFEGLLEVDFCLHLKDRGFKWVRSWTEGELHQIGKLHFSHGNYISKYHAAKMVDNYGVNIAYGHTHDIQSYIKVNMGEASIVGQSMGHLADVSKLDYMKNRPNNWTQAIGIAEIRKDGSFNLIVLTIINHTFSYNGKVYGPKDGNS